MLEIIIALTILGILAGTITGLTPGLHINTIAIILFSIYLKYDTNPTLIACFIIGMSVTHTFTDFIPSVFLGAPDETTCSSMQPTHKMMKKGRGYEAIVLSVIGGICGIIILIITIPLIITIIPKIYQKIKPNIAYILILALIFIFTTINKNKLKNSITIFSLSGLFGIIALNINNINSNFLLLPIFSGLFGISGLIESLKDQNKIPKQKLKININFLTSLKNSISGFLGGLVAGLLPGFGSAQSILIIESLKKKTTEKNYIIANGTIGTIDIIISFMSLYLIGNARSGTSVVISNIIETIGKKEIFLFISLCIFASGIAAIITIQLGKTITTLLQKIAGKKLTFTLIIIITLTTYYFTNFLGLIILITSTTIGLLAFKLDVRKSLLLGCLIIPTILFLL
jgi:putative membrane protein